MLGFFSQVPFAITTKKLGSNVPLNGFPGGSVVKDSPALQEPQETWVPSLASGRSPGGGQLSHNYRACALELGAEATEPTHPRTANHGNRGLCTMARGNPVQPGRPSRGKDKLKRITYECFDCTNLDHLT